MNVLWRSLARMSAKLIFLLSVAGCFGTLAYASEPPFLSSGNAITAGKNFTSFTSTDTQFFGGISVGSGFATSTIVPTSDDYSTIKFTINVDSADVGEQADLLVVLGKDSQLPYDGGSDTNYFAMVNEGSSFVPVNLYATPEVWVAQLMANPFYPNSTLQNQMSIEFGLSNPTPTMLYVFAGYRLRDTEKIVYSAKPVMLQMSNISANIKVPVEASDHESDLKTITLSSGMYHSCAIKINGNVACWGNNDEGQAPAFRSGHFTQVSVGVYHSCGILANGTVDCWGANTTGQAEPPNGSFIQISAGNSHTCGIRTNGTVDCWGQAGAEGYDGYGEEIKLPSGTFTQISAGIWGDTCGIRSNGSLYCWGIPESGAVGKTGENEQQGNFTQITVGMRHICKLTADGIVICYGNSNMSSPNGKFVQISSGHPSACGIRTDNTIECWSNPIGTFTGTFTQVSTGGNYACGLHTNGTVECLGNGRIDGSDYGQVDPPNDLVVAQPEPIDLNLNNNAINPIKNDVVSNQPPIAGYVATPDSGFAPLTVSLDASSSYDPDGSIVSYQWVANGKTLSGEKVSITLSEPDSYSITLTVIDNKGRSNSITHTITLTQATKSGTQQVSRANYYTCALQYDGTIICWGNNPKDNSNANIAPSGSDFTQISTSNEYACALKSDSSLFCWGNYKVGLPEGNFTQVKTSSSSTCVLDISGKISCWDNYDWSDIFPNASTGKTPGTIGKIESSNSYTQISISDTSWNPHVCALRDDRSIDCWGWNNYKQSTPPKGTFSQVSAGRFYTCALSTEGKVVCWGQATNYSIPSGTFSQLCEPNPYCGIKMDGSIACWNNGMDEYTIPTGYFTQISCAASNSCAIREDGRVSCWGTNTYGEASPPRYHAPVFAPVN